MSHPRITVLDRKVRTQSKTIYADDVLDLANKDDHGDIVGYAVVAIYENGYDTRVKVPTNMDDRFFYACANQMLSDSILKR